MWVPMTPVWCTAYRGDKVTAYVGCGDNPQIGLVNCALQLGWWGCQPSSCTIMWSSIQNHGKWKPKGQGRLEPDLQGG